MLRLVLYADLGLKQWQLHGGDPAASLNSLYELVQRQQDLMHSKEQMQEEMQKLRVDLKTADKAVQRLKCQNDQQAQEAGGLNIKVWMYHTSHSYKTAL